jgi:uncharacterized membrane protein
MILLKKAGLYAMAAFYIMAGFNHFRDPGFYLRMMPPFLPAHELLVQLSGIAESGLGLALLFKTLRPYAAWGIIALLLAVFPANFYMYQNRETLFADFSATALLVRLPLQLVLIAWAYIYTRKKA